MIKINMLMRMDSLYLKKCTNKCFNNNKIMEMKWVKSMEKK